MVPLQAETRGWGEMAKSVRDLSCCCLKGAFEMQVEVEDGRVGWDRRERLWVTGKQRGTEGSGAVAKVCASSVGQSTTLVSCVNNRKLERSLLHPLELC